jgi:hypothetical protein
MLLLPTFLQAQVINNPGNDCSDLLISELSINKKLDASNNVILNYAIEIYNPTSSTINLANYSILLNNSNSTSTSIPLSGSVTTGDVVVLSNSNSDLLLQAVSDILSVDFRYDNILSLELQKNNITIDAVGDKFQNPSNFNIPALVSDPYGYLASYDVNFDDFNNIQMVRGYFEKKGRLTFDALDLLNYWDLQLNADISGLGVHSNACKKFGTDAIIARSGLRSIAVQQGTQFYPLSIKSDITSVSSCKYDVEFTGNPNHFPNGGLRFQGNTTSNVFTLINYVPSVFASLAVNVELVDCNLFTTNVGDVKITNVTPNTNNASTCPSASIAPSPDFDWLLKLVRPCYPTSITNENINKFNFDAINKQLDLGNNIISFSLLNINGQEIYSNIGNIKSKVKLDNYLAGVYILKLIDNNNKITFHKIAL